MYFFRISLLLSLMAVFVASCATSQSHMALTGKTYQPKPDGFNVEVFRAQPPGRPFERISRLTVRFEDNLFVHPSLDKALPKLKEQARLSGADAIIEIQERSSLGLLGSTPFYQVTATGIRYLDEK